MSAKTVLRVMRRMGLKCPIRAANPWRRYGSYGGDTGGRVPNPLKRDFGADGPFAKLGADVAEFKVAGSKAYLAPVYDMAGKEITAQLYGERILSFRHTAGPPAFCWARCAD